MSDDKTKTGQPDRSRVNVHEDYELEYWTKKFGCTKDELKQAVTQVGPMADKVQRHLGK